MNHTMRKTQRQRIFDLLMASPNEWVPLPKILDLGIAQFGARILETRRLGVRISNRVATVDGKRHSWYRLETGFPSERSEDSPRQRNHTDAAGPTAAQQLLFIEETHGHGQI